MFRLLPLSIVVFSLWIRTAYTLDTISHPELDFDDFGGKLNILGSFQSLSFYTTVNETSSLSISQHDLSNSTENKLFIRDLKENTTENFAEVDGQISSVQPLSDSTILVNGDFTKFNDDDCQTPIIYNLTSKEVTNIFSPSNNKREDLPSLDGEVKTTFIDNDLIYIGGDFSFRESYGALVYNQTSKTLSELPFKGFGESAIVNAITKLTEDGNDDVDSGSIIFGGKFDTLGIPDLLKHNISLFQNDTNHTNSTNSSLITAEQKITLKYGHFSDVNGDGSNPADLICPQNNPEWAPQENSGGQWLVELPSQMKGIKPTKVRLYVPEGSDAIDLFRIYSYPNNGIMNLSYVDPGTNEIKYCDAWCPLATRDQLIDATDSNMDSLDDLDMDDVYVDEEDGSYSTYYDPDTRTKTLSYGSGFQEFSFENDISIDEIGLTVISWHGSKGSLAGFELYLNIINVYGNQTLNEPNCGEDPNKSNAVSIDSGDFQSVQSLDSSVSPNYQVAVGTEGKVTLYPNITYSGYYSIIMITPGCIEDNSCELRSIVNVTVFDSDDNMLEQKTIYQNNDYEKFDYLFYGHLKGSTLSDGQNRIEIEYVSPINPNTDEEPWMVIDRIQADIVELDSYQDSNTTNRTRHQNSTDYDLVELNLSGLFEYSLNNFSMFDESLIYSDDDQQYISPNNTFVGNSSINVLSSHLSNTSVVEQFNKDDNSFMILGDFHSNSDNLTLSNSNVINLKVENYNSTSNSSVVDITKREFAYVDILSLANDFESLDLFDSIDPEQIGLQKRDDEEIFGVTFNNSVTSIADYYDAKVLLGRFSVTSDNDSISIYDLSSDNDSINDANNFVIRASADEFYGFGNEYIDETFDTFTNVTVKATEYFVFSASGSPSNTLTWDNTNKKWITDPNRQLNISQAVNLPNNQQIISGSSFSLMDNYISDQAFIESNKDVKDQQFNTYNLSLTSDSAIIQTSYYINESVSVIGGKFVPDDGQANVGFIDTKKNSNNSLTGLNGDINFDNITVQTLYVDSNSEYLVIGYNGSITINDVDLSGGIIIYNLQNNSFTDFQPAELIVESGDDVSLEVNAIALLNDKEKLLVGGRFESAGSLDCMNLCVYDIKHTRWESPDTNLEGNRVTSINFFKSNEVLISGDLSDENDHFMIYNIEEETFKAIDSSLNDLSDDETVEHFLMCDSEYNDDLDGRFIAAGENFLKGFDGESWESISGINFSNDTIITDLKLLSLKDSNYKDHNDDEKLFSKDNVLAVSGVLDLEDYGLVNLALFDGTDWIPFIYSATSSSTQLGVINSILVADQFRFLSQQDVESKESKLSSGQVVGISLACALGSTTLLSLLYIIPYFIFFRKSKEEQSNERIGEKEMTDAVNPQELFHEIDLQRNQ